MFFLVKKPLIKKRLLLQLAIKELCHDWRTTSVLLAVIISVVTPLLILFGLKQGVVNTQRELLLNDPCNLEISVLGHYDFTSAWFDEMRKNPKVQFIVPAPAYLFSDIEIIDTEGKNKQIDLIPTQAGDPLLKLANIAAPTNNNQILVTHALSKRLHVKVGDNLHSHLFHIDKNMKTKDIQLSIIGILPSYSCLQRTAILTTIDFIQNINNYRKNGIDKHLSSISSSTYLSTERLSCFREEGFSILDWYQFQYVPVFIEALVKQITDHKNDKSNAAKARIFAATLDDVAPLADELRSGQFEIEVTSKASEIEKIKQLDRFLFSLLVIVGSVSTLGGVFALGGSMVMNIDNKNLQISQLRLLGLEKKHISLFLWMQGVIIASAAFLITSLIIFSAEIILKLTGKLILDTLISTANNSVKLLYLSCFDFIIVFLFILALTSFITLLGSQRATHFEVGERIRDA